MSFAVFCRLRVIAFSAALCATGCAKTIPLATTGPVRVVEAKELPPPTSVATKDGYAIGAGDKLIVDVDGFEDMRDRKLQVDAGGQIGLPIIGSVTVAGLTPAQASSRIAQALRSAHVRNPKVAINIEEAQSQFVTVEGEVSQPGNYPMSNDMTLMRSVAAARGLSEYAKLEDVVVFRTVGNQKMAALYNLQAIQRGYYVDPPIYSRDVVVVGNSPARRMFRDILTAAPLLISPIVAILPRL